MNQRNIELKKALLNCCGKLHQEIAINIKIDEFIICHIKLTQKQLINLRDFENEISEYEFNEVRNKIIKYCETKRNLVEHVISIISLLEYKLGMNYIDQLIFSIIDKQGSADLNDLVFQTKLSTKQVTTSLEKLIEMKKIKYSEHVDYYTVK